MDYKDCWTQILLTNSAHLIKFEKQAAPIQLYNFGTDNSNVCFEDGEFPNTC